MSFKLTRFKNLKVKTFTCEIVTPMFIGGANPNKAELRTASIKGALRFWWRALYGSNNIQKMREEENEIFGSTERKSNVIIKLLPNGISPTLSNLPSGQKFRVKSFPLSIIDYLAYGTYRRERGQNVYKTEYFKPRDTFFLILEYNHKFEEKILNAFYALVFYGGIGSKSRNGFGDIDCGIDFTAEGFLFENMFRNRDMLKFSGFSRESSLFLFDEHNSWVDALSEIGMLYRDARLSLENKHNFYKRALLAMPIEARNENIPEEIRNGRHAKFCFLHVDKLKNGKYRGKILVMPYKYYQSDKMKEYMEVCKKIKEHFSKKAKEIIEVQR